MARKGSSTIVQEEFYPPSAHAHEESEDSRLMDLDVNEESPFLRGQKRVSARRSSLPQKAANRMLWAAVAAIILCCAGLLLAGLYHYGERSWRFRVDSSDDITISGTENVTKAQIMEVMGADIGRNIFFIPLSQQQAQLEQIPWVEAASVMRFAPNRLQVQIRERVPVAFARVGPRISLIDAGGTLMDLPPKHKYSFPVIVGMNPGEPLSTRAPRMKAYDELVRELDAGGARYSQDLSEVDLVDLDDVKVRVNDPAGDVLVHLGSSDYLRRYAIYVGHVRDWRQQFQKLESVDLRYDNQIIVNPDLPASVTTRAGPARQVALTPAAAKAARAAGVQPAALISPMMASKAVPKPAFVMAPDKLGQDKLGQDKLHPKTVNQKLRGDEPKKMESKKTKPQPQPKVNKVAAPANTAKGKYRTRTKKSRAAVHRAGTKPYRSPAQPMASKVGPKPSPAVAKQQGSTD